MLCCHSLLFEATPFKKGVLWPFQSYLTFNNVSHEFVMTELLSRSLITFHLPQIPLISSPDHIFDRLFDRVDVSRRFLLLLRRELRRCERSSIADGSHSRELGSECFLSHRRVVLHDIRPVDGREPTNTQDSSLSTLSSEISTTNINIHINIYIYK